MTIVLQQFPIQLAIKVVNSIKTKTKSGTQVFPAIKGKLKLDYRMCVAVLGQAVMGKGVSTRFKQYVQEKYL